MFERQPEFAMMAAMIPNPNYNPPFNITRASHLVLTVRDLEASLAFYGELIGLVVSERTADTLYLRGLEEACHHSLVLQRSAGAAGVPARRAARVQRGGPGQGACAFPQRRPAGAMGRGPAPGPHPARHRSAGHAVRVLRHHDR